MLEDDSQVIRLYKNDRYYFEANIVETLIYGFTERYNVIAEAAKENPAMLADITDASRERILYNKAFKGKRKPTSTDYYSVTVLTLILMYSSITGLSSIKRGTKPQKTGNRINYAVLLTSMKSWIEKVMGCILITVMQALIVFLFSKLILNANWGSQHWSDIWLVIVSEAIMAVSIGTCIGFTIKNEGLSVGIINLAIPIFVMLGGGYVPIDTMGEFFQKPSVISPVKWTNQAIFRGNIQ